ncbi:MAG TPA: methyltransferase domain-containing protein [Thermoanaerobaculia bacterium]|nr:methyltransferase domain-containing protein [Thermoanaerobaculia bacterium]
MSESTYIHGTSAEEQRRLSLMNDVLLNPFSLRELALRGDERVIDFGSGLGQFSRAMARAVPRGSVVGIERDDVQRAGARRLAEEAGEGNLVEWRAGDVLALDLGDEWGTYDVAHTRFVLEHVPDPLRVVQTMLRAVRPGGRVVLADDDHELLRLWPEPPGWSDVWRAYIRTYDRIGNDPIVGRRLVELLHAAGAQPKRNAYIFFGGCAGMDYFDVLTANMLGVVTGAREAILSMKLFDASLFDVVVREYKSWAKRPDAAIWFAMSWAEGVRAN